MEHNPLTVPVGKLPTQGTMTIHGTRVRAPLHLLLDLCRVTPEVKRLDERVAVLQYYAHAVSTTNSKGVVGYIRLQPPAEATTPPVAPNIKDCIRDGHVDLDRCGDSILAPVPVHAYTLGEWFGGATARATRAAVVKKETHFRRMEREQREEMDQRQGQILREAEETKQEAEEVSADTNTKEAPLRPIRNLDDYIAARVGLAASRLHHSFCDTIAERCTAVTAAETDMLDRIETLLPAELLSKYFYRSLREGQVTSGALAAMQTELTGEGGGDDDYEYDDADGRRHQFPMFWMERDA